MENDLYKLVYAGVVEGTDEASAKVAILERFRINPDTLDKWFGRDKATVKQDLTQDQAWKLQYVLESMGVLVFPVLQTRSNLNLEQLDLVPETDQPASQTFAFGRYHPQGVAEFNARPTMGGSAQSAASTKRRHAANRHQSDTKSFKLTHMVAAAVMVMVLSYAGKQFFVGSSAFDQPIASLTE